MATTTLRHHRVMYAASPVYRRGLFCFHGEVRACNTSEFRTGFGRMKEFLI